jgi:hypothetical protein
MGKVMKREQPVAKSDNRARGMRTAKAAKSVQPQSVQPEMTDAEWVKKHFPKPAPLPKFPKRSKEEIKQALKRYHDLVADIAKLNVPPFDAVEDMRKMRDGDPSWYS